MPLEKGPENTACGDMCGGKPGGPLPPVHWDVSLHLCICTERVECTETTSPKLKSLWKAVWTKSPDTCQHAGKVGLTNGGRQWPTRLCWPDTACPLAGLGYPGG